MSSSPAGSTTPFSDYTNPRAPIDTSRVLEVYVLKNSNDPFLVLVPIARAGSYAEFWSVIKNDLYPSHENSSDATPMIYLLDPYMTRLRPDHWTDLLPSLRGKRLLILPSDAPFPLPDDPKSLTPITKRPSSWTSLTPKSTPTIPETSRITVDALSQRIAWPKTPDASPSEKKPPTRPRIELDGRSVSFMKTPEFAFDIALWCRFAPAFKPSLLMHFQFRELVVQAVPRATGLEVPALKGRIASALTNMLRRQGCLGTLTTRPMENFGDLLVKAESLVFALEDWPSCKESLGMTDETLRWVAEPVLMYCEIQTVHFPGRGERDVDGGRREMEERRLGGERRAERHSFSAGDGGAGRGEGLRGQGEKPRSASVSRPAAKPVGRGRGRGRRTVEVESASDDDVD